MVLTKDFDKSDKTSLEVEKAICDITESSYEKYLTKEEVVEELLYEKELIKHDIEKKNYINEEHKISLKNLIKKIDGELLAYQKNDKTEENKEIKSIIESGGLVVGKEDRTIVNFHMKKLKDKIPYPSFSMRKVEDIYYVKDDMHSLTIGATRSGKTRCLVLESIATTALSGENMIISDPKRRTL